MPIKDADRVGAPDPMTALLVYVPVAGYDPKHFLVTYLAAQHETEIWLAPLGGARLLVPYRASISTPMGLGKVCVDHF